MDWLTFTVGMTKALAWPIATTIIALAFREQIRALLGRMKKGKVGPAEFEFAEIVRELKQTVAPAAADTPRSTIASPGALRVVAEPRAVILETWLKVEAAAEKLGRKQGVFDEQRPNELGLIVRLLRLRDVLEWENERLYKELRALRNSAAHELDFNPSVDSVLNFVSLAQQLEAHFLMLAGEA